MQLWNKVRRAFSYKKEFDFSPRLVARYDGTCAEPLYTFSLFALKVGVIVSYLLTKGRLETFCYDLTRCRVARYFKSFATH